jgi:hypothetical protein
MKLSSLGTVAFFLASGLLQACGTISISAEQVAQSAGQAPAPTPQQSSVKAPLGLRSSPVLNQNRFHLITPTGEKIFAAIQQWETGQVAEAKKFAQPAMCASNASRVLEMAGIRSYSSPLLPTMVNAVKKSGGLVIELPKDRTAIAKKIASVFGGRIPVGSFVSGCLRADCSGQAGDGHIALVGDIDSTGSIKIYHNNWYRPDNNPQRAWYPYMIPMEWYNLGFRRKWMSTPWVYLHRDASGLPQDINVRIPEIDDLDPTNYFVTLTIPVEIMNEVKNNQGVSTDGRGVVTPYLFNTKVSSGAGSGSNETCSHLRVLDANDPTGVNLRSSPSGNVLCKLPNGRSATLLSSEGLWSKVKTLCQDKPLEGYVFSALTVTGCSE